MATTIWSTKKYLNSMWMRAKDGPDAVPGFAMEANDMLQAHWQICKLLDNASPVLDATPIIVFGELKGKQSSNNVVLYDNIVECMLTAGLGCAADWYVTDDGEFESFRKTEFGDQKLRFRHIRPDADPGRVEHLLSQLRDQFAPEEEALALTEPIGAMVLEAVKSMLR